MSELIGKLFDAALLGAQELAKSPRGIRCEDFISAAAAFTGEICMRKAADFDSDNHSFTPGQRIFSQKINVVLSGDHTEWRDVPVDTAFGSLHHVLTHSREVAWPPESFPGIAEIYQNFAKGHGPDKPSVPWGYIPLTVSSVHLPQMPPLRAAFEIRRVVAAASGQQPVPIDILRGVAGSCLIKALLLTRSAIDNAAAIRLAMETINGMAKTAPVLPRHLQQSAGRQAL